jgi:hypothetical protein
LLYDNPANGFILIKWAYHNTVAVGFVKAALSFLIIRKRRQELIFNSNINKEYK